MTNIKKEYFKLSQKEYEELLKNIKDNPNTLRFFSSINDEYYFLLDDDCIKQLLKLHQDEWELNNIINSFSAFTKQQIIQMFLIDEIKSTNNIENIFSTRHDIYYLLNNLKETNDLKTRSITNAYKILLDEKTKIPNNHKDIRELYDDTLSYLGTSLLYPSIIVFASISSAT